MKKQTEIIQEYKNLLEMLTSLNEQINRDPRQTDLITFVDKHKTILSSLQEQMEQLTKNTSLQKEYPEEYNAFLNELNKVIVEIKREEDKAIQLLQKDFQHVKGELSRIQGLKRANPQYNMKAPRDAIFIDKIK